MDCDWHFDQYPWECTCGVTYRQQRDRIEAQAAEIKRLKNILRDCDPESMSWLDARDAALGETQ
jgi:hypothetical protein